MIRLLKCNKTLTLLDLLGNDIPSHLLLLKGTIMLTRDELVTYNQNLKYKHIQDQEMQEMSMQLHSSFQKNESMNETIQSLLLTKEEYQKTLHSQQQSIQSLESELNKERTVD